METVVQAVPWQYDSTALNIPWRKVNYEPDQKLIIGVMEEDPGYPLHAPVRRALADAVAILRSTGHKIVEIPSVPERSASLGARIAYQFFGLGSTTKDLSAELGEPLVASVACQVHPFAQGGMPVSPELSKTDQFHHLNLARVIYAEAWKQVWLENGLDVVLAPPAVSTAVPHDTFGVPVYTVMWSALDVSTFCSIYVCRACVNVSTSIPLR